MSFWEYAGETPNPRSIHGEHSFPMEGFWELWKEQYRLGQEEPRDLLFLSDRKISSQEEIPAWFGEYGVETSCWTHARLRDIIHKVEGCSVRTVVVELQNRKSTVWHGGNPSDPLVLYGVSTSDLGLPVDSPTESDCSKSAIGVFLKGAAEREEQNRDRCTKLR